MRAYSVVIAVFAAVGIARAAGAAGPTIADPTIAAQRPLFDTRRERDEVARRPDARAVPAEATARDETSPVRTGRKRGEATFFLGSVRVEGNTVLEPQVLSAAIAPHVRRETTLSELLGLTRAIRKLYRDRGYFLARVAIPPQDIGQGPLVVVVREGRPGHVRVVGNRHYSDAFILRHFAPALEEGVLRDGPLIASLLTLNDFVDLHVRARLEPGERDTTDVVLQVKDRQPLRGSFEYNDYGYRLVGRNRAFASIDAGNSVLEGDVLTARLGMPFPGLNNPLYQVAYGAPVGDRGARVTGSWTSARTRVGFELEALGLRAEADVYSLRAEMPFERTLTRTQAGSFALTAKTIKNFTAGSSLTTRDDLRIASLGYDLARVDGDRSDRVSLVLNHGLGTTFNGRANGDPLSSRPFAGDTFTKLNGEALHVLHWDAKTALILRGAFQLSSKPLVVAELFDIAGPYAVRAFVPAEYLGDDGYVVTAELERAVADRVRVAAFIDQGGANLKRPLPGELSERSLTAVGTGVRLDLGHGSTARADLAVPVSSGKNIEGESAALYGQVVARY